MKLCNLFFVVLLTILCSSCGGKSIPCQECGSAMCKTHEEDTFLGLKEQFECENCGNWVILVAEVEVNNRQHQEESDRREELEKIKQAKLDSIDLKADSLERAYRVACLKSGYEYEFQFGDSKEAKRMKIEMADLEYEYKKAGGTYFGHYLH